FVEGAVPRCAGCGAAQPERGTGGRGRGPTGGLPVRRQLAEISDRSSLLVAEGVVLLDELCHRGLVSQIHALGEGVVEEVAGHPTLTGVGQEARHADGELIDQRTNLLERNGSWRPALALVQEREE